MSPAGVLCLSYSGAEQMTDASICSGLRPASFMASLYASKASSRIDPGYARTNALCPTPMTPTFRIYSSSWPDRFGSFG